ncbi:MAG: zinc dependent phospholipase C family protein [Treponema sp.]|nr:zinc dependent phospholipase C family protein [Treponema sp.]
MPAIFAHWLLGEKSIKTLDARKRAIILEHRETFNLGLQGSDFTFFKNMGADKEVSDFGNLLHDQPAVYSIKEFTKVYKTSKNPELLAYILGFIGHFTLDTNCHWYVFSTEKDGVDHNELETEFDRYLMIQEGLNPAMVKIEEYIFPNASDLKNIAKLYEAFGEIPTEKFEQSFLDFYKFKKIIRKLQILPSFLINLTLKIFKKEHLFGIFMKKKTNKSLSKYINSLHNCFEKSLSMYPTLIENFMNSLDGAKLDTYFNRDFTRKGEND